MKDYLSKLMEFTEQSEVIKGYTSDSLLETWHFNNSIPSYSEKKNEFLIDPKINHHFLCENRIKMFLQFTLLYLFKKCDNPLGNLHYTMTTVRQDFLKFLA